MSNNNTRLPAEVVEIIELKAEHEAALQFEPVHYPSQNTACRVCYRNGATEYATKLHQVEQEIQSLTNQLKAHAGVSNENLKLLQRENAALKAKWQKLAQYARSLCLSVTAHPHYTGKPKAEWTGLVQGIDTALAEWKGEKEPANPVNEVQVWVKTTDRLPGWNQPVHWRIGEGPQTKGKTPLSEMFKGGYIENWQWLDESAGEKEVNIFGFAEWTAVLYKLHGPGKWEDDDGHFFTTAQLWDKYQKEDQQ